MMSQDVSDLVRKLQSLSEAKLTNELLVPLLETLGYTHVEYSGGPAEHGVDLICWRLDEFEEPELMVAQVKRFKLSRRVADPRGLEYVILQLMGRAIAWT